MSEPFRPYESLWNYHPGKEISGAGAQLSLRCFQFISPETIPYGRFCWNQECQYCRVSCQLPAMTSRGNAELQIYRDARHGSDRIEPRAQVVPAIEVALRLAVER